MCQTDWSEALGRRTAAQGACNCPTVMCPFILGATSGQEGEMPHKGACNRPTVKRSLIFAETSGQKVEPPCGRRTTAPRLYTPSASLQPTVQHGGPGPHVMQPAHRSLGVEKSHRHSRQCIDSSGPSQKTEKISFQNQCDDFRHPVHGSAVRAKCESHGPVNRGNGHGHRRDHRRASSNCINKRAGAAGQPPIRLWPHQQDRILS
jgi:hypothetical protein